MIPSTIPKVSVIIPTYNRADLLPRAVNSVLSQTYDDYEIIIVDDHSSDNTQDAIAKFSDPRIRSIRHRTNRRQSAAINTGISNARGEYIAFLDDDDEWLPTKLEGQVAILDSSSANIGLIYCWMDMTEGSTGNISPAARGVSEGNIFDDTLALNIPGPTVTLMVRSLVARNVGGFDENLSRYNDADFICRVTQRCHVSVFPEVAVMSHFDHEHEQMGHDTSQNLAAAADFIRAHTLRFADELDRRPRIRATLLRRLAGVEMMRGNRRAGITALVSALKLDPLGVSQAILRNNRLASKIFVRSLRNPSGATQE